MRGHGPDCDLRSNVCTCGILYERMLDRWNEQRKREAWTVEIVYIWLPLLGVIVLTVMLLRWLGVIG